MRQDLAAFVNQAGALPSLPAVYLELTREVDSPYSSLKSIGDIIRKDPSLTSRLLQLANSALYGGPSRVGTIEEALQLIGLREIRDLALATTVITLFPGIPSHLVDVVQFWKHSVACGVGSALLAEERQEPGPGRFFVGGLLHDVGRLIMYLRAPGESAEILQRCQATGDLSSTVETEVLGFDHATLGAALLEAWNLPLPLVELVRCHHYPSRSHLAPRDAALVHIADFLASALGLGDSGEYAVAPLAEAAWQQCLLDERRLEAVVKEIEARYLPLCEALSAPGSARAS